MLEENHYYPFGLTMAAISDKALKANYVENKCKFDAGAELQNKEFADGSGLEMYETNFRGYDPQLGRFTGIDAMAEMSKSKGPYGFVSNNPMSFVDPSGLSQLPTAGQGNMYAGPGTNEFAAGYAIADGTDDYGGGSGGGGGNEGNGNFWSNILSALSAGASGSTWTADASGNGAGTFDFTDPGPSSSKENLNSPANSWTLADLEDEVQNSSTIGELERELGIYNYERLGLSNFVALSDLPSETKMGTSEINLNDNQTLSDAALSLAHELNNAINSDLTAQLKQEAIDGTISESDFAEGAGQIEMNGVIYQALVASQLNISYNLPSPMAGQIQSYQAGAISLGTLQSWAYTNYGSNMYLFGTYESASSYYSQMYYFYRGTNK